MTDIYAKSKLEIAQDFVSNNEVTCALLIGDTEHDYDVAKAIGADCLLIANGHQSIDKLLELGVHVIDDISKVCDYVITRIDRA